MRDLALAILDELKACRGRGRHELRFRLHQQRKLGFIETLHKQHVAGGRDDDLASRRDLIDPGVAREKFRPQSDPGVPGHVPAIDLVFADVFQ